MLKKHAGKETTPQMSRKQRSALVAELSLQEVRDGFLRTNHAAWAAANIYIEACKAGRRPICYLYANKNYALVVAFWKTKYEDEGFTPWQLTKIKSDVVKFSKGGIENNKNSYKPHYIQVSVKIENGEELARYIGSMFTCPREYAPKPVIRQLGDVNV